MRSLATLLLIAATTACASFDRPGPYDAAPLRARAVTQEKDGLRVSATLLTPDEIEAIFGVDLGSRSIQPVWIEIENRSDRRWYFLATGVDPEYYPPLEVGYAFHSSMWGNANEDLEKHLAGLMIDYRSPIRPGESVSGFLCSHANRAAMVLDTDFLSGDHAVEMTLFLVDPANTRAVHRLEAARGRFGESELVHLEDPTRLREALEALPGAARDEAGRPVAPLNVVVIGELRQWVGAFLRRGFRDQDAEALRAFGRPPDSTAAKVGRWVEPRSHVVRLWQTPLRYRGAGVWIAQVACPLGGRFADDDAPFDPEVDAARGELVGDLVYSQNLRRIGWVKGAEGDRTDGLRAVLFFAERTVTLDGIEFLDWEDPAPRPDR